MLSTLGLVGPEWTAPTRRTRFVSFREPNKREELGVEHPRPCTSGTVALHITIPFFLL